MLKRHILAVEDNDQDFEAFCWAMKRAGRQHPVVRLTVGDEVIPFLEQRAQEHWPMLMVLDLNLPGMGGLDILKVIRSHPEYKKIPVVVLTTSQHEQDVEQSYLLGANSYLKKSLDLRAYAHDVQVLLDYWMDRVVLPERMQ